MGRYIFHPFDLIVSLGGQDQWFKVKVAVFLFLLLDKVCNGVYEEYSPMTAEELQIGYANYYVDPDERIHDRGLARVCTDDMLEHCGNTIDMADIVLVAGKLKLSSSDYQQLENCTVTIEPWFKWDHIAIEVKDYNLNEGACVIVEQGSRYTYSERQLLDPLLHICQRGGDALVTEYQLNTNASKRLIVTFSHGTRRKSNFVLRFFAYEALPCYGIVCDGDKCLSNTLRCDDEYLFGDCATQTWCPPPPKRPEKPFKLTTAHIIGIIGACLAMLQLLYCICRHCLRKLGSTSEEPQEIDLGEVPQDGDNANRNGTDNPDSAGINRLNGADDSTRLPADGPDSSSPGAPLNVPPPAYDDVISSDKYNTKYWQP